MAMCGRQYGAEVEITRQLYEIILSAKAMICKICGSPRPNLEPLSCTQDATQRLVG